MCCEVIIWSKFGVSNSYHLIQVRVVIWSKVIFDIFIVVSGDLFLLSYHVVCVFVPTCLPIF